MSIELRIVVPDDTANPSNYIEKALAALGYVRDAKTTPFSDSPPAAKPVKQDRQVGAVAELAAGYGAGEAAIEVPLVEDPHALPDVAVLPDPDPTVKKRHRRTKEEVERERLEKAAALLASKDVAAISTGEERIDPALTAVDTAEDAEQDAADEAAEQAARRGDDASVTLDDVRNVLGEVHKKFGIKVAAKIPTYIGSTLDALPPERYEEVRDELTAMLDIDKDTLLDMLGSGPSFVTNTPAVAETAPEFTRDDLLQAMFRFAAYADGVTGLKTQADAGKVKDKLINTFNDLPEVFVGEFGENVKTFNQVADEQIAHAVKAIDAAIASDRFKRKK